MFLSFVLFNLVVNQYDALPAFSKAEGMIYLANFGYLDPALKNTTNSEVDGVTFSSAVSKFQSFFGLNPTGVLDEETSTWMSKPRCGVSDIIRQGSSARRKRHVDIQGNQWKKKRLTYRISKYTKHLEQSVVDREIARAFQLWADVTELAFTFVKTGKVDIEIRFESGSSHPKFDGPGGTLGHAFFPDSGDTHFDDAETWTINSTDGTNLFQVAVHEFGHALGLGHTEVKPAVMKPIYEGYEPDFKLQADDIDKIQKRYGRNIDNNWIKEKFKDIASTLEALESEVKAMKRELTETKSAIENLKMTSDTGTKASQLPSSCQDLEFMGQKINGIFLVKNETRLDVVFCDFDTNESKNKRIGQVDVKSEIVYFYVQRSSPLHANHQTAIPFEIATFNIGTGMNLVEGIFTTPRTGIYFFSFTGLASFPVATTSDRVHLEIGMFLGGVCISKAQTEETNTVESQYGTVSLQSTLNLVSGEGVWVEITSMSPGVRLYGGPFPKRNTHFTGWMLEEEIFVPL